MSGYQFRIENPGALVADKDWSNMDLPYTASPQVTAPRQ